MSRADVRELLDLDALIDALAPTMEDLSAGRASVPDRIAALVPEHDALLAVMPGYVPSLGALVSKLVSLFPRNAGGPTPTHQALLAVFDPETGSPVALLDGTEITAVRTGACSALSVRLLARKDASVLAVVGTGVQARSHARAVVRVRPIVEVRIAGRDPRKADALATELAQELGVPIRAVGSYQAALDGAAVVCATTHALEPVVRREWLAPGTHVPRSATTRPVERWTIKRSSTRSSVSSHVAQRSRPFPLGATI
jgi:ornithine cyclodeaminase